MEEFLARYGPDSVLFVREVFGVEPYPDQVELLRAYDRRERRISKRSGHGVGKSAALAWMLIHHILTRFPQKSVCTAPTTAQLFDALAAETKTWVTRLPEPLQQLLAVKSERIELAAAPDESFISFRTSRPETPEALAGVHSDNVLLVADEASGIPEQVFEAAVGSMSGAHATTILCGNPVRSSGLFFDVFNKPALMEKWVRLHVSCVGHPNVSPDFIEEVATRYGEDSNAYRVRVLGEFPRADDDTLISYEQMEAALKRDVQPQLVRPVWGLDCARFGSDRSALAKRRGNVLTEPVTWWSGLDTMQLAGRVLDIWNTTAPNDRPSDICVDAIGIGAGVADRLRELGLPARAINVSESPALTDRFVNLRSELWWKAREWFALRDCNLSNDDLLGAELTKVRYEIGSSGKIAVESKEKLKKRGHRSPDMADAFVLTFASMAVSAIHGGIRTSWSEPIKRAIRGIV